ncbi:hypothetical protein [Microlunatus speluncae]|uniref:hypothetical protein n=1 Tax=Microlunatus speluncae TaxID=2594267 RepID=UPI00126635E3|nr:hypothetical protein [Microlunatus speluncae]
MVAHVMMVGASLADLTPPLGTELAGLFDDRISTDVESPLLATAFAFDSEGRAVLLIVCDLIYLPADLVDRAKTIITERVGVPADRVVISCTHTHTGPATIATRVGAKVDSRYLEGLPVRIAEAAVLAWARRRPATIAVGTATVDGICFNRRYFTDDDFVITHWGNRPGEPRPAGPTDPTVTAILAEDLDGRPFALWANLSLHYVGIDDETMISSDYYGRFAAAVRAQLGDQVVAALSNGASGDINNADPRRRVTLTGTRRSTLVARAVAAAAVAATAMAERRREIVVDARSLPYRADRYPVTAADLELAAKIIGAEALRQAQGTDQALPAAWFSYARGNPVPEPLGRRFAHNLAELAELPETRPTTIGLITLGELGLVALPGEVFVEHGLRLKEHSPHRLTAIIGLANDHLGYLPTRRAYELGGYETWRSPTSWTRPGTGEELVETVLEAWKEHR